jgi:hypothetical protein
MRRQITDQLENIGASRNQTVEEARANARETMLASLEIYPVSAPEYRKLLLADEDDPTFLDTEESTGIPALRTAIGNLVQQEQAARHEQVTGISARLWRGSLGQVERIRELWTAGTHTTEETEKVQSALDAFLAPKRKEADRRVGAFREFLQATVDTRIRELVLEARAVAEEEVDSYLEGLKDAHWATLRAAVSRGGAFHGRRNINLPDDIAIYFQEPMAAVWSKKLLRDVRKRTSELASDQHEIVREICDWASEYAARRISASVLRNQNERMGLRVSQMQQVGKEAVSELRDAVKQRMAEAIAKPIRAACQRFVAEGQNSGPGVKSRIIVLFHRLAKSATTAAQEPAIAILESNFRTVRSEIGENFEKWGDPIEETASLIIGRHEEFARRSDERRKGKLMEQCDNVVRALPSPSVNVRRENFG